MLFLTVFLISYCVYNIKNLYSCHKNLNCDVKEINITETDVKLKSFVHYDDVYLETDYYEVIYDNNIKIHMDNYQNLSKCYYSSFYDRCYIQNSILIYKNFLFLFVLFIMMLFDFLLIYQLFIFITREMKIYRTNFIHYNY